MTCLDTKIGNLDNQTIAQMLIGAREYVNPVLENMSYEKPTAKPWIGIHETGTFADFTGDIHQKAQIYFNRGETETDLTKWRPVSTSIDAMTAGGACGDHNPCKKSYDEVPGWGFSSVAWGMYERQLRTKEFCVDALRTRDMSIQQILDMFVEYFHDFGESKVQEFIKAHYYKDSQKYVLTNKGFEYDIHNPTKYPILTEPNAVAALNYGALYKFYHRIQSQLGEAFAVTMIDGRPLYTMSVSDEALFDSLYHDDKIFDITHWSAPQGLPDLIKAFNYRKQYAGMFVTMLDNDARRFNVDGSGDLVLVPRYLTGVTIPGGQGKMDVENEDWHNAVFEELMIFPTKCYKVLSKGKLSSVGGGTIFGTPPVRFEDWMWFADRCKGNEWGLTGYWVTSASLGMEPLPGQMHIKSLLFRRAQVAHNIQYLPARQCTPPDDVACDNDTVTGRSCPCAQIVGVPLPHPTNPNIYFIKFAPSVELAVLDEVTLELATGGTLSVTGEVVSVTTADETGFVAELDFGAALDLSPDCIVGIACGNKKVCFSRAQVDLSVCNLTAGTVTVTTLDGVLNADAGDTVQLQYGDGTTANVAITSFSSNGVQVVLPITVATLCSKKDLLAICVPTATTAACPACSAATYETCSGAETAIASDGSVTDSGCNNCGE
jgi:hypothetical protein